MSLKETFFRSSLWVVAGTGMNNLASFAVFAILARLLDPVSIGVVTFALVIVEVSRVLAFGGLPEALVQRATWDNRVASSCFWANLLAGLVFALLIGGAGGWVLAVTRPDGSGPVLAALAVVLVVEAARAVHEAKLRREFAYKALATRAALCTLVSGAAGIGLAFAGYGVWALVAQRVIYAVGMTALTWARAGWRPERRLRADDLREFLPYILRLTPARLLTALNKRLPEFALGLLVGPAAIAFYRVGLRALEVITQLTIQPVQQAALSVFARLPDSAAIGAAYGRVTRATAIVACPAYLGVAVTAPDVIALLFGPQWEASGPVLAALAAAVGATTFGVFSQPALTAAGRPDLVLNSTLGSFAATGAASLAGALVAPPALAPAAVALAQTARNYLTLPFWFALLRRGVGLAPRTALGGVAPAFLASLGMVAGVLALRHFALGDWGNASRAAASAAAGAVLYALLLLIFARRHLRVLRDDLGPLLPRPVRRALRLDPKAPGRSDGKKDGGDGEPRP